MTSNDDRGKAVGVETVWAWGGVPLVPSCRACPGIHCAAVFTFYDLRPGGPEHSGPADEGACLLTPAEPGGATVGYPAMLRFSALVALPALLAACSTAEEDAPIAFADNGVPISALPENPATERRSLLNPVVPTLQTMAAPDFASARMTGPGCQWRESDDGDALFAFDAETGVVKVAGSYVRMLPDRASGGLPTGAFRVYQGGQWRVAIKGADGDPVNQAGGAAEWAAGMTFSVDRGPSQRFEGGILSCRV